MIEIIASLMSNNANSTMQAFKNAKDIWDDALVGIDGKTPEELGATLRSLQMGRFERECGGTSDGKFVMAYSAAAYYYDKFQGYEENESRAKKLLKAIQKSSCSLEVKGAAKRAFPDYF